MFFSWFSANSHAFLVKKNGGSDDGKLYALKAAKIPDSPTSQDIISFSPDDLKSIEYLNSERDVSLNLTILGFGLDCFEYQFLIWN